jgi:hypothetical protein
MRRGGSDEKEGVRVKSSQKTKAIRSVRPRFDRTAFVLPFVVPVLVSLVSVPLASLSETGATDFLGNAIATVARAVPGISRFESFSEFPYLTRVQMSITWVLGILTAPIIFMRVFSVPSVEVPILTAKKYWQISVAAVLIFLFGYSGLYLGYIPEFGTDVPSRTYATRSFLLSVGVSRVSLTIYTTIVYWTLFVGVFVVAVLLRYTRLLFSRPGFG